MTYRFILALALLACAPATTGCGSTTPAAQAPDARQTVEMAYSIAAVALNVLAEVHVDWMAASVQPSKEEAEVATKINELLHAARDALAEAKPWLETGKDEAKAKLAIRESVDNAREALALLKNVGLKVPEEVSAALDLVRTVLGGAT